MNAKNMEQHDWKTIASQLRKPEGEMAHDIGMRMNESNVHINRYTHEALDLADDMEVLEIGMGNGHFVRDLLDSTNIYYTGIDYSFEMVQASMEKNIKYYQSGRAKFLNTSIENFPATEALFDRIFSVNTLYFWENPEKALKVIRTLLFYNGQLCISIRPKHVMENHPFVEHGFTLYSRNEVCRLLEANGFDILAVIERKEAVIDALGEPMTFESLIVKATRKI